MQVIYMFTKKSNHNFDIRKKAFIFARIKDIKPYDKPHSSIAVLIY